MEPTLALPRLSIERVPIDSLVLDPANARLHDGANLDAIAGSLRRFGQAEPLVVRREDREVSLNVNASPVRDQEGRIIGAILIASDVTEKQHTLARIRDSEARHRLLFQENPVPMTVYDGSTLR